MKCISVKNKLPQYNTYVLVLFDATCYGTQKIQMFCILLTREEWGKDFWNTPSQFPNDGSKESNDRLNAFKRSCMWLDMKAKELEAQK